MELSVLILDTKTSKRKLKKKRKYWSKLKREKRKKGNM